MIVFKTLLNKDFRPTFLRKHFIRTVVLYTFIIFCIDFYAICLIIDSYFYLYSYTIVIFLDWVGFFGFSTIVYWTGLENTHKNLWSFEHAGLCCYKKCQD